MAREHEHIKTYSAHSGFPLSFYSHEQPSHHTNPTFPVVVIAQCCQIQPRHFWPKAVFLIINILISLQLVFRNAWMLLNLHIGSLLYSPNTHKRKKNVSGQRRGKKKQHLLSQRQQVHAFNITDPNKKTLMFSAPNLNPLFGELYADCWFTPVKTFLHPLSLNVKFFRKQVPNTVCPDNGMQLKKPPLIDWDEKGGSKAGRGRGRLCRAPTAVQLLGTTTKMLLQGCGNMVSSKKQAPELPRQQPQTARRAGYVHDRSHAGCAGSDQLVPAKLCWLHIPWFPVVVF